MNQIWNLLSTILVVLLLATVACKVRAPSVAEQKELLSRGTFPSGAPSWIATPATGNYVGKRSTVGLVGGLKGNRASNRNRNAPIHEGLKTKTPVTKRLEAQQKQSNEVVAADGPLGRITAVCPEIENEVTSALTTVERSSRITKYRSLTNRCPHSADLLVWLGRDQLSASDYVGADRSAQRALTLDPESDEVRGLLAEIRKARVAE